LSTLSTPRPARSTMIIVAAQPPSRPSFAIPAGNALGPTALLDRRRSPTDPRFRLRAGRRVACLGAPPPFRQRFLRACLLPILGTVAPPSGSLDVYIVLLLHYPIIIVRVAASKFRWKVAPVSAQSHPLAAVSRPACAIRLRPAGLPSGADQAFHRDEDSRQPAPPIAVRKTSTSPLNGVD